MKQILLSLLLLCSMSVSAQDVVVKRPIKKSQSASRPKGYMNGHEWVDMGLSVKWATCNIGASTSSEYGNYYAFGETKTKKVYSVETMTFNKGTNVDTAHDVARLNWGASWRLPTKAEFNELVKKCRWKWTTINGHGGYKVTAANGNSIFLPAAGFHNQDYYTSPGNYDLYGGVYWTSTSHSNKECAYTLSFNIHGYGIYHNGKCLGETIRPVTN